MANEYHRGRLLDHVHLRARNIDTTKRFYKAVLDALGVDPEGDQASELDSYLRHLAA